MKARRARWFRLLVLVLLVAEAVRGGAEAVLDGRRFYESAHRRRAETAESALRRVYGAGYLESIARVERNYAADAVVPVAFDFGRLPIASLYWANYLLAPRRLVPVDDTGRPLAGERRRVLPRRRVVVVGDQGEPLAIADRRAPSHRRGPPRDAR